jgi:hypothetical protein
VAYAVPSSLPYSWQRTGDFLNYGQWKHGATWAVSDGYLRSGDADVHAPRSNKPRSANPQPLTHETV